MEYGWSTGITIPARPTANSLSRSTRLKSGWDSTSSLICLKAYRQRRRITAVGPHLQVSDNLFNTTRKEQRSIQLPRCFCIVTPARPEESPLDRARVYFILHQSQTNRSWPASPLKTKYRSCTPLASFREQPTVLNPLAGSIFRVPHKGPSTASRRTSI